MITIGMTLFIIGIVISFFLEGFFRATKWWVFEEISFPPVIAAGGTILSFIFGLFWWIMLPTVVILALIVYGGYRCGKVVGRYKIVRRS